nr:MAG TPA: hypothetical protein [Caudoviricetes sp.]
MCESPEELQELFLQKRKALIGKWVTLRLNDDSVIKLRIEGVGGKTVRLGKYMKYDKIFEEDDLVAKQLMEKVQKL